MSFYKNKTYINDLKVAINSVVKIEELRNCSILVTGATGLIGSFIVDMLILYDKLFGAGIKVYALGRKKKRLEKRFLEIKDANLFYVEQDVNYLTDLVFSVDYIIHAASNAYPSVFNMDPVGTMMSNILGTKNLLDYAKTHNIKRLVYISSGEVYGQGDVKLDFFEESYAGYIDSMQARSCYPNSKRAAETLCISYTKQYQVDTVIVRPCHTYGPNSTASDNRANVQFVNNVLNGEDIILKSEGKQLRSYCYISDCVSAILTVMLHGKSCEAYNIANTNAIATIADFASMVAEQAGRKVIYSNPDDLALAERSPVAKQVLDTKKLEKLGWNGKYSVKKGIAHTLAILLENEE